MKISKVSPELFLVSLDMNLPGFGNFICSWIYKGKKKNIAVDPGPASTVPEFKKALKALDIDRLDIILLTHIHADHAGGIGDVCESFPEAKVVCHNTGLKHLSAPQKLWEGSLKVLGDVARAYGPIKPVPFEKLINFEEFDDPDIRSIYTPGHAEHHVSFIIKDYLFAGEAAGVFGTVSKDLIYLRPATPPKFFLETSIKSIDALINTDHKIICYGHFEWSDRTPYFLEESKKQILLWESIIRENKDRCSIKELIDLIAKEDKMSYGFKDMPPDVQECERIFFSNSIKGFIGYISKNS